MQSILGFKDRLFYGWVVVAAFFIIALTLVGIQVSFGVFFKSIESEFHLTRAATSAIVSTQMVLGSLFAFVGGWASDRYGPKIIFLLMGIFAGTSLILTSQTNSAWQLFIAYSLLISMGTSATFVVITSIISRWFDKKRGSALGIATSGAGLGPVVMAPFATFLIFTFDWRMAYIVIGVITWLIVIPLSMLLKKNPHEIGMLPDGLKLDSKDIIVREYSAHPTGLSLSQAIKTRSFWLITFVWLLFASCIFFIYTHLVPHVTDIGFSAVEAASILSLMGVCCTAGRVLMGIFSDRIGGKHTAVISALFKAGALLWLIGAQELWMLYLFAVVDGFAHGGISACMGVLICDTFGLGRIGTILGVLDVGFGIGAALGPFIGGLLYDVNGSYTMAFIVLVLAMVAVALLTFLTRRETHVE